MGVRSKDDTIIISFVAVYIPLKLVKMSDIVTIKPSWTKPPVTKRLSEPLPSSNADWKSDRPLLRDNHGRGIHASSEAKEDTEDISRLRRRGNVEVETELWPGSSSIQRSCCLIADSAIRSQVSFLPPMRYPQGQTENPSA